jgi:hypothetical protein
MNALIVRRQFLQGLVSAVVCAPAVVRASSLMTVSAKLSLPPALPSWANTHQALAWLQYELERRFAETLFGREDLVAEAEGAVAPRAPVFRDAKITALWELRSRFGPRGSPPKPFEELPADLRASVFSIVGAGSGAGSGDWSAPFLGAP